tara:strand:+ start:383 stop:589 length:207 start_codon:yes stop_codon:yes gene_type:complete
MSLRKNINEENVESINSEQKTLSNKNRVDINVLLNRVRDSEKKEKKIIYISISLIFIVIACLGLFLSL